MLYKTHQKFGQAFGLLGLMVSVSLAWIPTFTLNYNLVTNVAIFFLVYLALRASLFGSEFPDIDSKGSVPAYHWIFIRQLFSVFNVKHRGKFSHDFVPLLLLFGTLAVLGEWFIPTSFGTRLAVMGLAWFVSKDLANVVSYHLFRKRVGNMAVLLFAFCGFIVLLAVAGWFGFLSGADHTGVVLYAYRVFIGFSLLGAYSHLIADMLTNEGVYLAGFHLQPARVVLAMSKFPFIIPSVFMAVGYLLADVVGAVLSLCLGVAFQILAVKTDLKTGGDYEKLCRMIVSVVIVPLAVLVVYLLFGGSLDILMK